MDDVKHHGPPLSLTLPMGPTSPAVSHASSLASQMSSLATSVTLEDIIGERENQKKGIRHQQKKNQKPKEMD